MEIGEILNDGLYKNRRQAGVHLSRKLHEYKSKPGVVVLGLPRGGVPVAYEVAQKLNVPLDIFNVRKLGVPGQGELALGAIASGNVVVFNEELKRVLSSNDVNLIVAREKKILEARERSYSVYRDYIPLFNRTVILVDDGLATGASMAVAIKALRKFFPAAIVVAVPVAAPETCEAMEKIADRIVCAISPRELFSVGAWYEDFSQTTDEEVIKLLSQNREHGERSFHPWIAYTH